MNNTNNLAVDSSQTIKSFWSAVTRFVFIAAFSSVLALTTTHAQETDADGDDAQASSGCGDQYNPSVAVELSRRYQEALVARDYALLEQLRLEKEQADIWAHTTGDCEESETSSASDSDTDTEDSGNDVDQDPTTEGPTTVSVANDPGTDSDGNDGGEQEEATQCAVNQPAVARIFRPLGNDQQVFGDCKVNGCQNGAVVQQNDDSDVPLGDVCNLCFSGNLVMDPAKDQQPTELNKCLMCSNGATTEIEFDANEQEFEANANSNLAGVDLIADKINNGLSRIGLSDWVEFSEIAYKRKTSTCCNPDAGIIEGGNVERFGELKIEINKGGGRFPIPSLAIPDIDREFDFHVAVIELDVAFGVYFSTSATVEVSGGVASSQCSDEDECTKASATANFGMALEAVIEAIACFDSLWTRESCAGISAVPAALVSGLEGGLYYNNVCSDGLSGSLSTKALNFQVRLGLDLPGAANFSWSWQILPSYQIFPR